MKGAVLYGPRDVRYVERAEPKIVEPTDVILRLSVTCVRGSDLWPYRGIDVSSQPTPMGHEYCGIVEEVGSAVRKVRRGQFAVGSFFASDNTCAICSAGYQSRCIHAEYVGAGGAQAPFLRVPLADGTLVATPEVPSDDLVPGLLARNASCADGSLADYAHEDLSPAGRAVDSMEVATMRAFPATQAARRLPRLQTKTTGRTLLLALAWAMALNPAAQGADSDTAGSVRGKSPTETSKQRTTNPMKIRLTVDGKAISATLITNETAKDFLSLLPMTLTLDDYAATEKIAYLPRKLSTEGAPAGSDPSVGDITYYAPWGNLAIFYRDFGYSEGLIRLGRIDSGIEALSVPGSLKVTIEPVEK